MVRIAAVLLGVIPAFVLLSSVFSDTSSDTAFAREMLVRLGVVAALYAFFGIAFGFSIPGLSWRWGLWLNVPALFLLAFFIFAFLLSLTAGDVDFGQARDRAEALLLIGFFAGALVAACLGAYAGARARQYSSSER